MSWHYRIRRRVIGEEKIFDIVEIYTTAGYTINGITPMGNTKKELFKELEMMLADAKKYPVLYDKG
jgi:hypothetical protein